MSSSNTVLQQQTTSRLRTSTVAGLFLPARFSQRAKETESTVIPNGKETLLNTAPPSDRGTSKFRCRRSGSEPTAATATAGSWTSRSSPRNRRPPWRHFFGNDDRFVSPRTGAKRCRSAGRIFVNYDKDPGLGEAPGKSVTRQSVSVVGYRLFFAASSHLA